MLNNKTLLKIFSLVIAILLWIYVMGEVNPETKTKIYGIEVSLTNTDMLASDGLAVAQEEPVTVNATIEGKRSDVNRAKKKGLSATVDVGSCRSGRNTETISLNLPEGITLDSISQETVDVKVEKVVWEERPVQISFEGDSTSLEDMPSGSRVKWVTGTDPGRVTIYGAKSLVNKVDHLAGEISADSVRKDVRKTKVRLTAVDADGEKVNGVSLNRKKAVVSTQLLTAADISLTAEASGLNSSLTVSSAKCDTVRVAGTADALKTLKELKGTADLGNIKKAGTYTLDIDIEQVPDGIYLADDSSVKGEFTVRKAD